MEVPDHFTCLLRSLYAVKKQQLEPDMVPQTCSNWERSTTRCILSSCLFNLYAEWKAPLDEAQTGIKIARRNISNLRYTDDTTQMAESDEEVKRLLMKVKEEGEKLA